MENRQPFHDFIFGTRQIRQPLQGRRISRAPKTRVVIPRPNQEGPAGTEKGTSHREEVLGPEAAGITTKNRHHFLGRMQQNPKKTRELPRKINIEEVEPPKKPKRYEFYCGNPVQEHPRTTKRRKLPRKVNIEELEEPKKYENYCAKPVSDPCKSTADQRKARELPR